MSWAPRGKTSRIEDEAYCLLGLFNVNMPLIYGEVRNAFFPVTTRDYQKFDRSLNIRLWVGFEKWNIDKDHPYIRCPIFAESPKAFENAGGAVETGARKTKIRPYAMTNLGLKMRVSLTPVSIRNMESKEVFFIYLNFTSDETPRKELHSEAVTATVESDVYRLDFLKLDDPSEDIFRRIFVDDLHVVGTSEALTDRIIYIETDGGSRRQPRIRTGVIGRPREKHSRPTSTLESVEKLSMR